MRMRSEELERKRMRRGMRSEELVRMRSENENVVEAEELDVADEAEE